VERRFCQIGTKRSVLWPSKYAKIRFRPGSVPDPAGSSGCSPRPRSRLWRGHPSTYPPHSAPTHLRRSPCIPQYSSQIYADCHGPSSRLTRPNMANSVTNNPQYRDCSTPQEKPDQYAAAHVYTGFLMINGGPNTRDACFGMIRKLVAPFGLGHENCLKLITKTNGM